MECKGSKFDKGDGKHHYIHLSLDRPAVCMYCDKREG